MAKDDRITNAIDKMIEALNELKEAWIDAQEFYTPKVVISDEIPIEIAGQSPVSVTISNEPPVSIANQSAPTSKPVLSFESEPVNVAPVRIPGFNPGAASPHVDNESNQTFFCENCGTKIRPGAKFCASCGTPV
jgi:hypothetical protein